MHLIKIFQNSPKLIRLWKTLRNWYWQLSSSNQVKLGLIYKFKDCWEFLSCYSQIYWGGSALVSLSHFSSTSSAGLKFNISLGWKWWVSHTRWTSMKNFSKRMESINKCYIDMKESTSSGADWAHLFTLSCSLLF